MRGNPHGSSDSSAWIQAQARLARYVAVRFRELGLQPYPVPTPDGVQSYPRPGQLHLDYARSYLQLVALLQRSGRLVLDELGDEQYRMNQLPLDTAAFLPDAGPPVLRESKLASRLDRDANALGGARVTVLAGPQPPDALGSLNLRDQLVLYVPPSGLDAATRRAVLTRLYREGRGVVLVSDEDSVAFARRVERARTEALGVVEHHLWDVWVPDGRSHWVLAVRPAAVAGLLSAAGLELPALRAATTPFRQELVAAQIWLWPVPERPATDSTLATSTSAVDAKAAPYTIPYAAAMLEGADSVLKQQQVIIAANLRPGDEGTELAGLLALARAFSQPAVRLRRSIIFVATVDAPPLLGGSWFVASAQPQFGDAVAALTLERLRGAAGTVVVDGVREVTLDVPPALVAMAHPDLHLAVVDAGTVFRRGAVAYPFARNLIPSLALSAGEPVVPASRALSPTPADEVASAIRLLQFAFYVGDELATIPALPRWTALGRERYAAPIPSDP